MSKLAAPQATALDGRSLRTDRVSTPDLERQPVRTSSEDGMSQYELDDVSGEASLEHDDDEVDMLSGKRSQEGEGREEERGLISGARRAEPEPDMKTTKTWLYIASAVAALFILIGLGVSVRAFLYGKSTSPTSTKNDDKASNTGPFSAGESNVPMIDPPPSVPKIDAGDSHTASDYVPSVLSNGTHEYDPTIIVISLDGFRADYLDKGISPALQSFADDGIRAEYLQPSFPTVTFPNHYTMVTGLYPESHGIVGNIFHDPVTKKEFHYTVPSQSIASEWWGGEPIWVTSIKQSQRSAVLMWPGCASKIADYYPTYSVPYQSHTPLDDKTSQILDWLDMPRDKRPTAILAYAPEVDSAGHHSGPDSKEVEDAVVKVDKFVQSVLDGVAARNLTEVVNVLVVSDHGMAGTSANRLIYIDDYIDYNEVEFRDGWPLFELRPVDGVDVKKIYTDLKTASLQSNGSWEVYMRDVDMPDKYHHSNSDRIAPIIAIPAAGWSFVTHTEFNIETTRVYHPRGIHGYSHESPLMRAIFVARGPAFTGRGSARVKRKIVPPFQNTELYGLMARTLGLKPAPNNGTAGGLVL